MRKLLPHLVLLWASVTVTLGYTGIKFVPQLVILGFVVISGILQGIFWRKSFRRYLVAPLLVLMILGASLSSFLKLALWLSPPVTADGHPVMAIGQSFFGIGVGFLFWVLLSWLYFARLKPDVRHEAAWVWVFSLALSVAFIVDYFL